MVAASETPISISKFKGLNIRDPLLSLESNELSECTNYDLGVGGELKKRTGFARQHNGTAFGANAITLLGFFNTPTIKQIIGKASDNLYYSTDGGVNWTAFPGNPWSNVYFGVQYGNIFYIVRSSGTIVQWDGTTATAIAGSPTGTHCAVFKDRLFVINTLAAGNLASRLYFSAIADFSATGWPSTNFIDVQPGDGDFLVAVQNLQDIMFVFKAGSTWHLFVQGDPSLWSLKVFNTHIGCLSSRTILEYEGLLYFLGLVGVYRTDGTTLQNLAQVILPLLGNQLVEQNSVNKSSAALWEDKYILSLETYAVVPTWGGLASYTWSGISSNSWGFITGSRNILVYHLRPGGWTKYKLASLDVPHTWVSIVHVSNLHGLYGGDSTTAGRVFKFGDPIYQDVGANYACTFETKEFDLEQPTNMKRGKWVGLTYQSAGNHDLFNIADSVTQAVQTLVGDSANYEYKAKGPGYFHTWRLRSSATHSSPLTVFGFTLHVHAKKPLIKAST